MSKKQKIQPVPRVPKPINPPPKPRPRPQPPKKAKGGTIRVKISYEGFDYYLHLLEDIFMDTNGPCLEIILTANNLALLNLKKGSK